MKVKHLLGQIHLWTGLLVSLLFFLIAFSGALYTWAPEIARIIYKQRVEPRDAPFVSVSTLKVTLDRDFPSGDFRTALYRDPASAIQVLLYGNGTYYHAYHTLSALVYDIHFGTVLGLPGRLLVFFASLIGASLPVTGILVWWGKRRKRKKN